ncbi:MAG: hypothetical protein WCD07_06435 [Burkholderiales bacterium]
MKTWLMLLIFLSGYIVASQQAYNLLRKIDKQQLSVIIPVPLQILLNGGDRYLAANLATFRALVVGPNDIDAETVKALGSIHRAAAFMNPAHEDNYYISQAIIAWNGQADADIYVQDRATQARPWDSMPPFFAGIDKYTFKKDAVGGAKSMEIAAQRPDTGNRQFYTDIAARWYEKNDDPRLALELVQAMQKNTRDKEMKRFLGKRLDRIEATIKISDALNAYKEKFGKPAAKLTDLVEAGLLKVIPTDPMGQVFTLKQDGNVVLINLPNTNKPR